MASNTLNLIAILSLTISILLSLYPQPAFSFQMEDFDGEEEYVLDHPVIIPNLRSRSRFLKTSPTKGKIRKGADCDPHPSLNICKGISANNETSLLYCSQQPKTNQQRGNPNSTCPLLAPHALLPLATTPHFPLTLAPSLVTPIPSAITCFSSTSLTPPYPAKTGADQTE
ncbi:hypothetical protein GOBAR_AA07090 [Gossypium barbadense]|uniref:Uncharacterized protein n=1 Tax=Gossypium barbadense TaxID=3634 RepID=A0A2P5YD24_GOSBA|nr:hypothetical protein GOBAR_AA07090 [Gossypium barbadense]